jgi:hypothetical protein
MLVSPTGWTRRFFGNPKKDKRVLNAAVAHGPQHLSVVIINREWYNIWKSTIYGELRGRVRVKAQIHDSLPFIYKDHAALDIVMSMMQTKIPITDPKGITRFMQIPSDLATGNGRAVRWSDVK